MPIYDYQCTNPCCNTESELIVKAEEKDKQVCPVCKHPADRIQISQAPSYKLKGKGWSIGGFRSNRGYVGKT